MAYLHSKKILHLDLKPLNILVTQEYHIKVSDFGFSKQLLSNAMTHNAKGETPIFSAPEIFLPKVQKSYSTDIYSFGMVLFQLFTLTKPPFDLGNQLTPFELAISVSMGNRPPFPSNIQLPKCAIELIEKCWSHKPEKRPASFLKIIDQLNKFPQSLE